MDYLIKRKMLFIEKANKLHKNKYNYTKVDYSNSRTHVEIICDVPNHGSFRQIPSSHIQGSGCPKCSSIKTGGSKPLYTKSEFIKKAKILHNNKYNYDRVIYKLVTDKVEIGCKVKGHGYFFQKAVTHLAGKGCPKCGSVRTGQKLVSNTEKFIDKANSVHNGIYFYNKCHYVHSLKKVEIICKTHWSFMIQPKYHLRGIGCPKCKATFYSKVAVKWIEEKSKSLRMKNVQHAKNRGEYTIPGTKIRVDGYHAPTKTVFEFHGDAFHGNPKKYKPLDRCHPYKKNKTAKQLYRDTINRDKEIVRLGYSLIVIWESDYRSGLKDTPKVTSIRTR